MVSVHCTTVHGKKVQIEGNEFWKNKCLIKGNLFHISVPEIWIKKYHLPESNIHNSLLIVKKYAYKWFINALCG